MIPMVIEDLNAKGILASCHCRQLEYKMALRGGTVIMSDRLSPSSKLCRFCGCKHEELKLSVGSKMGVPALRENDPVARSERGAEPLSLP